MRANLAALKVTFLLAVLAITIEMHFDPSYNAESSLESVASESSYGESFHSGLHEESDEDDNEMDIKVKRAISASPRSHLLSNFQSFKLPTEKSFRPFKVWLRIFPS